MKVIFGGILWIVIVSGDLGDYWSLRDHEWTRAPGTVPHIFHNEHDEGPIPKNGVCWEFDDPTNTEDAHREWCCTHEGHCARVDIDMTGANV